MTENSKKLLDLLHVMLNTDYEVIDEPITPESVYKNAINASVYLRGIIRESNELLDAWIYPLLSDPARVTDEQADELFELAQALFQPTMQVDTKLALDIYSTLVKYAREIHSNDKLIKYLYWEGLAMFYLNKYFYNSRMMEAFMEAASFNSRYKEFANRETRMYINRAMGNIYVSLASFKLEIGVDAILDSMNDAMTFWTDPDIRAFDPDMPWEQFIYHIHQNTISLLDVLRHSSYDDFGLSERVYDSACFLIKHQEKHFKNTKNAHTASTLEYSLICSKYHTGRLSARETGKKLMAMSKNVKEGDYSHDATYRKTHLVLAAMHYTQCDPEYSIDELNEYRTEVVQSLIPYVAKLPRDASKSTINTMIAGFVDSAYGYLDSTQFLDVVLKLTTFRHMPTYTHSIVVGWLSQAICEYLCDNNPAFLIGVMDTETEEDVKKKRTEIIEYANLSGLCHDVGKITYIDTISVYTRNLTENEFQIIYNHPETSYEMLKNSSYNGIAEIARGHHKWYDETNGYPVGYDHRTSKYRALIEVVSVCDSIEAGTDTVSRPYSEGKPLQKIIEEIQDTAGTRYSPVVAEALKNSALVSTIDEILYSKRIEAYYTAYTQIHT